MGPPSSCAGFSLANYFGVCTSQIAAWCIWLAFFDSWRAGANDFCQEGFFCVWIRWSFHSWSQMPSIPSHDKLLWHVRHCRAGRHLAFSTPYGESGLPCEGWSAEVRHGLSPNHHPWVVVQAVGFVPCQAGHTCVRSHLAWHLVWQSHCPLCRAGLVTVALGGWGRHSARNCPVWPSGRSAKGV